MLPVPRLALNRSGPTCSHGGGTQTLGARVPSNNHLRIPARAGLNRLGTRSRSATSAFLAAATPVDLEKRALRCPRATACSTSGPTTGRSCAGALLNHPRQPRSVGGNHLEEGSRLREEAPAVLGLAPGCRAFSLISRHRWRTTALQRARRARLMSRAALERPRDLFLRFLTIPQPWRAD